VRPLKGLADSASDSTLLMAATWSDFFLSSLPSSAALAFSCFPAAASNSLSVPASSVGQEGP